MTLHELPAHFELATPRPARYSLGASVLVILALTLLGWAAVGFAVYSVL